MGNLGSSDVDSRLEEQLIDGILYAFQEQTQEVSTFYPNSNLDCIQKGLWKKMMSDLVEQLTKFLKLCATG